MLHLHNNPSNSLRICWPESEAVLFALADAYIARETSLSLADQVKDVPPALVAATLAEARAARTAANTGEAGRAQAAETLRQNYVLALPLLRLAINQLKVKYYTNLARLEEWNLETVASEAGIVVRMPTTKRAWIAFLQAYVAQEASLPVEEQITSPPLAQLQSLNANIQSALAARTSGRIARKVNVEASGMAMERLDMWLQLAAAILVIMKFDGVITQSLEQWGFRVIAYTPPTPPSPPESEPTQEEVPAP